MFPTIRLTEFDQPGYSQPTFRRHVWLSPETVAVTIAGTDLFLVAAAAAAVFDIYFKVLSPSATPAIPYILPATLAATLFIGAFERLGGYKLKQLSRLNWQLTWVSATWALTVSILLATAFLGKVSEIYSRGWALVWIIAVPALLITARGAFHCMIVRWMRRGYFARNVLIVGAGNEGQLLIPKLQEATGITICGLFDDRRSRVPHSICGVKLIGTTDDLLYFARRVPVDEVIIALPLQADQRLRQVCEKLKVLTTDVRLSIEPLAEGLEVRTMSYVGDILVLDIANRPLKHWSVVAKWIEDKILCTLLLILTAPLVALIALCIKLDSRGPVIFVQPRYGFNNEVIHVFKFRTMYVDKGDPSGAQRTVQNDPRVTRVGRVLRSLSLDELPQLINVLRGDMSLVGPRPHAITMKAGDRLYCDAVERYLYRHRVKPGMTGWAQVNGLRGEVDTIEKARNRVECDLNYIEHWSVWLDIIILIRTVAMLVSLENAY
jgi:Undecaprenyl-phosphate glucose phosphotransferase